MIYEKKALEGCYSVCNRTSITYLHATPDYDKSQFYPIEEKKRVMLAVAVILLINYKKPRDAGFVEILSFFAFNPARFFCLFPLQILCYNELTSK